MRKGEVTHSAYPDRTFAHVGIRYSLLAALSRDRLPEDTTVFEQCRKAFFASCDWLISAERAGLGDADHDDLCAFVDKIQGHAMFSVSEKWNRQVLDLGYLEAYVLRDEAVRWMAELKQRPRSRYKSNAPLIEELAQVADGVLFLIPSVSCPELTDIERYTIQEAAQGEGIGMATECNSVMIRGDRVWVPKQEKQYAL